MAGVAAVAAVAGFAPSSSPAPGAPTIVSIGGPTYFSGMATNYVGTPGRFELTDRGSTITGYLYGLDSAPIKFVAADADGFVTLPITPDTTSDLVLNVEAVDGSGGTPSPVTSFDIEARTAPGNIATLAWWKLVGVHSTARDQSGNRKTARLSGDASFTCPKKAVPDGYHCWMHVTGQGGQAVARPFSLTPIVANTSSFSVSAWVNLTKCAISCVVVSEDATQVFQFALKYQKVCRANGKKGACWKFTMPHSDQAGSADYNAASTPGSARLGTWTQLTGVFDATRGMLQLYVDGTESGTSPPPPISPWSASPDNPVRIGNLTPGGTSHDWNGRISDVCAFYGALQPADAVVADHGDKAHPHDGCAALFAKYP